MKNRKDSEYSEVRCYLKHKVKDRFMTTCERLEMPASTVIRQLISKFMHEQEQGGSTWGI